MTNGFPSKDSKKQWIPGRGSGNIPDLHTYLFDVRCELFMLPKIKAYLKHLLVVRLFFNPRYPSMNCFHLLSNHLMTMSRPSDSFKCENGRMALVRRASTSSIKRMVTCCRVYARCVIPPNVFAAFCWTINTLWLTNDFSCVYTTLRL